jgi:hypothetical protein
MTQSRKCADGYSRAGYLIYGSEQGKSMRLKDETPDTTGRDDAEGFRNRLTEGSLCGNLDPAIYQDSQSIAQNPVYLAIASQKHCEIDLGLWLSFKKANQILFYQEWNKDRPLSSTTDIALIGDGWKNKYRPLAPLGDVWKVGELYLQLNGRE